MRGRGEERGTTPAVAGYSDIRRVGSGGFSEVFSARQESVGQQVALKVLKADVGRDAAAYARRQFGHEVKLMGRLGSHQNLVGVYNAGMTRDKRPYIAMELFDGSYADRVRASGTLMADEAIEVIRAVASALGMAHHLDQLHRDVKPENVLVRAPKHHADIGKIALGDFGIARDAGRTDRTRTLDAMSVSHAAPEVLEGKLPGRPSDIYSLGSTAYALLAGRGPFDGPDGETEFAFAHRVLSQSVPPMPRTDLPPALVAVVERMLAKDPDDRYQTTAELLADLAGLPVTHGERQAAPSPSGAASAFLLAPPETSQSTETAFRSPQSIPPAPAPPPAPTPSAATPLAPSQAAFDGTTGFLPPRAGEPDPFGAADEPAASPSSSPHRRWYLIAGAVAVLLAGFVLFGGSKDGDDATTDSTIPPKMNQITPSMVPTDLQVTDHKTSVTLSWHDNVPDNPNQTLVNWHGLDKKTKAKTKGSQIVDPGVHRAEISGLDPDPNVGYCFRVLAIASADAALKSNPTCIRDVTAAATDGGTTATTTP